MGKLTYRQKIVKVFGLKPNTYYKVKSLVGGVYLSDIFNASDLYAVGQDTITIYQNGDINSTPIIALNADPEWVDTVTEENLDFTLIPVGAVIRINSSLDHTPSGAILVNYYQGKTSLKKQNLTKLKSFFYHDDDARYIFKSATNNTLAQIFDPNQFEPYADTLSLKDLNLNSISLNGFGNNLSPAGSDWLYNDFYTNANNLVIPNNTVIEFNTVYDININVGGGAIIQKYYSGKFKAEKTYFDSFNTQNYASLLIKLKTNGFPTFGEFFGGSAFITANNGLNIDNRYLFNVQGTNTIEFLDENLQSIVVYYHISGSFFDILDFNEYTDNDTISAGSTNGKTNIVPKYLVMSIDTTNYSNSIIKLFNNNLGKIIEVG